MEEIRIPSLPSKRIKKKTCRFGGNNARKLYTKELKNAPLVSSFTKSMKTAAKLNDTRPSCMQSRTLKKHGVLNEDSIGVEKTKRIGLEWNVPKIVNLKNDIAQDMNEEFALSVEGLNKNSQISMEQQWFYEYERKSQEYASIFVHGQIGYREVMEYSKIKSSRLLVAFCIRFLDKVAVQFGKYRDLVQLACTQIQASVYKDHEKEVHAMMKTPYFEIASMLREKNQQHRIALKNQVEVNRQERVLSSTLMHRFDRQLLYTQQELSRRALRDWYANCITRKKVLQKGLHWFSIWYSASTHKWMTICLKAWYNQTSKLYIERCDEAIRNKSGVLQRQLTNVQTLKKKRDAILAAFEQIQLEHTQLADRKRILENQVAFIKKYNSGSNLRYSVTLREIQMRGELSTQLINPILDSMVRFQSSLGYFQSKAISTIQKSLDTMVAQNKEEDHEPYITSVQCIFENHKRNSIHSIVRRKKSSSPTIRRISKAQRKSTAFQLGVAKKKASALQSFSPSTKKSVPPLDMARKTSDLVRKPSRKSSSKPFISRQPTSNTPTISIKDLCSMESESTVEPFFLFISRMYFHLTNHQNYLTFCKETTLQEHEAMFLNECAMSAMTKHCSYLLQMVTRQSRIFALNASMYFAQHADASILGIESILQKQKAAVVGRLDLSNEPPSKLAKDICLGNINGSVRYALNFRESSTIGHKSLDIGTNEKNKRRSIRGRNLTTGSGAATDVSDSCRGMCRHLFELRITLDYFLLHFSPLDASPFVPNVEIHFGLLGHDCPSIECKSTIAIYNLWKIILHSMAEIGTITQNEMLHEDELAENGLQENLLSTSESPIFSEWAILSAASFNVELSQSNILYNETKDTLGCSLHRYDTSNVDALLEETRKLKGMYAQAKDAHKSFELVQKAHELVSAEGWKSASSYLMNGRQNDIILCQDKTAKYHTLELRSLEQLLQRSEKRFNLEQGSERLAILEVFVKNNETIESTFFSMSLLEAGNVVLTVDHYWTIIRSLKLPKQSLVLPDIQSDDSGNEIGLSFLNLVEAMVCVAHEQFYGKAISLSASVQCLFAKHIGIHATESTECTFKVDLNSPGMQAVFREHRGDITSMFQQFASARGSGRRNSAKPPSFMQEYQWITFVRHYKLLDHRFRIEQAMTVFSKIQDTTSSLQADKEMIYSEFCNALAAVAMYKNPDPYLPVSIKTSQFLTLLRRKRMTST